MVAHDSRLTLLRCDNNKVGQTLLVGITHRHTGFVSVNLEGIS
jgi:hypothetical protein